MMQRLRCYLYLLPALAVLAVFAYWPFYLALRLALYSTDGLGLSEFVGMANFTEMLNDPVLWTSFGILAVFLFVSVPLQIVGPLLAAKLIVGLHSERAAYVYRVLLVLPMVVPAMVGILVWRQIYSSDGALNHLLDALGLAQYQQTWLGNPATVVAALILMGLPWAGGINLLIYLAGLMNIPPALRESMIVDGATPWRMFWALDLPLLKRQIQLVSILGVVGTIQSYEFILVLTNGGPANTSMVPALHLFRSGFEFGRLGYASAIGCLLFVLCLGFTILNLRLTRGSQESAAL